MRGFANVQMCKCRMLCAFECVAYGDHVSDVTALHGYMGHRAKLYFKNSAAYGGEESFFTLSRVERELGEFASMRLRLGVLRAKLYAFAHFRICTFAH